MTFQDRKIVEMTGTQFGVVLLEREAEVLRNNGFNVKSKTLELGEDPTHYLVVWVNSARMQEGFNLSRLEQADKVDVVIHPEPWRVGGKQGIKAYVVATWEKS